MQEELISPVLHQELNFSPFRHYCCPLNCMEGDWNHIPIQLWRWVLPRSTQDWRSAYSKACVARNSLLTESSLQHRYLHKSILTAVIHTPCWHNKTHSEPQERKKWLEGVQD